LPVLDYPPMRIMLTGGGTGGHVFPLLAVAKKLRKAQPECAFRWFGSIRIEAKLVPEFGIEGTFVPFTFSYRRLSMRALAYYLRTLPAWIIGLPVWLALRDLRRFKPDIVLSSGGYVSAPMLLAARIARVPYALVEINAVPGRATVFFASHASRIYCATEGIASQLRRAAAGSLMVSGYPADTHRSEGANAREHWDLPEGVPLVVVVGGSTGAKAINELVNEALGEPQFVSRSSGRLAILHQLGREPTEAEKAAFSGWAHYRTVAFDPLMAQIYPEAALYIGRAGAATIAELVVARLPAVFIPYPHHADRQQYLNAKVLAEVGAAVILEEGAPGNAVRLRELVEEIALGGRGKAMRDGFKTLQRDGAQLIANDMLALAGGRR